MRKIKFYNSAVCDYVALGHGNKHSLINVYASDIVAKDFPLNMLMGFYCEMETQKGQSETLDLDIMLGRKKHGTITAEFEGISAEKLAVIAIPFFRIVIDAPSRLRLIGRTQGFAATTFIQKEVISMDANWTTV